MAADGRDLRIRCIARKRSAFAPIRTTLLSGPTARSAQETPAMACVPSYEAPGTLNGTTFLGVRHRHTHFHFHFHTSPSRAAARPVSESIERRGAHQTELRFTLIHSPRCSALSSRLSRTAWVCFRHSEVSIPVQLRTVHTIGQGPSHSSRSSSSRSRNRSSSRRRAARLIWDGPVAFPAASRTLVKARSHASPPAS